MGTPTQQRILDAAERLFAEHGFGATSLRHITTRAQVNLAAVNYHFGSKDALVEAVFARRLIPMNRERLRRLDEVTAAHAPHEPPLNQLIEAFVAPALDLSRDASQGGARFIKLLGRSYTEPSAQLQAQIRGMYSEVIERFRPAFAQVLPDLSHDELYWRLHFLVGVLAYCMSGADMMRLIASCRVHDPLDTEMLTRRLTTFLTAGMRAAPSAVITQVAGTVHG